MATRRTRSLRKPQKTKPLLPKTKPEIEPQNLSWNEQIKQKLKERKDFEEQESCVSREIIKTQVLKKGSMSQDPYLIPVE